MPHRVTTPSSFRATPHVPESEAHRCARAAARAARWSGHGLADLGTLIGRCCSTVRLRRAIETQSGARACARARLRLSDAPRCSSALSSTLADHVAMQAGQLSLQPERVNLVPLLADLVKRAAADQQRPQIEPVDAAGADGYGRPGRRLSRQFSDAARASDAALATAPGSISTLRCPLAGRGPPRNPGDYGRAAVPPHPRP